MTQTPQGKPIKLKTERFLLRSCVRDDASKRWIGWAVDPDVMTPLNAPTVKFTITSLGDYISGFDNFNRYLIGIFGRSTGQQIGFHTINVSRVHRVATINVIIGDKDWWGKRVVLETRAALLDHFFSSDTIEKAVGRPISRNFPAIFNYKAQGWTMEGILRGQVLSLNDDGLRFDQYHFGMLRHEWLERKQVG